MSKQVTSQKMEMICDGCGKVKEFELVGATQEDVLEMSTWFSHARKVWDPNVGLRELVVHSCSIACAPSALVKLVLPAEPEPDDQIDLAKLRHGSTGIN